MDVHAGWTTDHNSVAKCLLGLAQGSEGADSSLGLTVNCEGLNSIILSSTWAEHHIAIQMPAAHGPGAGMTGQLRSALLVELLTSRHPRLGHQ